jgi:hypothetical protein
LAAAPATPFVSATTLRRISGISTTQLKISAKNGYRHILYDLFVTGGAGYNYYDIAVGTRTFMRIPDKAANSNTVNPPQVKYQGRGFLWFLSSLFGEQNLPNAAEDEDIVITASSAVTRLDAYYAEIKPDDVSSHTVAGGSDAPLKPFIEILDTTLTSTGTGQNVLNENMPTGLGLLDLNGRVKATTNFTLQAVMADYVSSGTNYTEYSRLHIYDEDEELFTPDNHEGLLIDEVVGANDCRFDFAGMHFFRPDKDYVFAPNHQVSVLADVAAVTGTGSKLRVALIGMRQRV